MARWIAARGDPGESAIFDKSLPHASWRLMTIVTFDGWSIATLRLLTG